MHSDSVGAIVTPIQERADERNSIFISEIIEEEEPVNTHETHGEDINIGETFKSKEILFQGNDEIHEISSNDANQQDLVSKRIRRLRDYMHMFEVKPLKAETLDKLVNSNEYK